MISLTAESIVDNHAEATVVATLIHHPEYMAHAEYLKSKHFKDPHNANYYWAVCELYQRGIENIDAVNIANMLNANKEKRKLKEDCNVADVQGFIDLARFAARDNIEEYKMLAKQVVTLSYKRDLFNTTKVIQSYCLNGDMELAKLSTLMQSKISKLNETYVVSDDIVNFGDIIDELWNNVCESRMDGMVGLPFKSPLLTEYCQLRRGELCLLSARMKAGKSAFFLNEACNAIKADVPVLYIDTEMPSQSFMVRMLANLTQIPIRQIERGTYTKEEEEKLRKTREWIKSRKLVHKYMPVFNESEILETHKIVKYKMGLGLSVYDYFKCNNGGAAEISAELGAQIDFYKNEIAGMLNVPVLAGAQMNRENRLADSDRLERYCSTSLYWRAKTGEEIGADGGLDSGNFCLRVALNRNGDSHAEDEYINFKFDGDRMNIVQAELQGKKETPFG